MVGLQKAREIQYTQYNQIVMGMRFHQFASINEEQNMLNLVVLFKYCTGQLLIMMLYAGV